MKTIPFMFMKLSRPFFFEIGVFLVFGYVCALHVERIFTNFGSFTVSEELADSFIMFEQWLVHSGLFATISAVYFKKMTNIIFIISLIFGHFLNENYILTHHLHYFLQNNMLYPYFLYSPVGTVNVQYGVLFPYFIYLIILAFQLFFKNTRSITRTYVLIFASVVWSTTFIFHLIFVQWSLMDSVSILQDSRTELANKILINNYDGLLFENCEKYEFVCFAVGKNDKFDISDYGIFESRIESNVNALHVESINTGKENIISQKYDINLLAKEISGNQFTYSYKNEESLLLIDKLNYNPFVWLHKVFFGFFVGLAHLVWMFGAYYFLQFHQTRFKRLSQ